mmetsp:Transcript_18674/g.58365  ORF Transcript_18674/g.58365 Transcript_18674/m.58365 type:complete len:220 (+) Transcript_18674:661-1320(+)
MTSPARVSNPSRTQSSSTPHLGPLFSVSFCPSNTPPLRVVDVPASWAAARLANAAAVLASRRNRPFAKGCKRGGPHTESRTIGCRDAWKNAPAPRRHDRNTRRGRGARARTRMRRQPRRRGRRRRRGRLRGRRDALQGVGSGYGGIRRCERDLRAAPRPRPGAVRAVRGRRSGRRATNRGRRRFGTGRAHLPAPKGRLDRRGRAVAGYDQLDRRRGRRR